LRGLDRTAKLPSVPDSGTNFPALAAWQRSGVPLIFLSKDGRVAAVNEAATKKFGLVGGGEPLPSWIADFVAERFDALARLDDPGSDYDWAASIQGSAYRLGIARVEDEAHPGVEWLISVERGGPTLLELVDLAEQRFGLSDREAEVIALLSDGLSNKQIASALEIAVQTVKFHVQAIMKKSGTSSRTELLARLFGIHLTV